VVAKYLYAAYRMQFLVAEVQQQNQVIHLEQLNEIEERRKEKEKKKDPEICVLDMECWC